MAELQTHHHHYIRFFEELTHDSLLNLSSLFTENARFKDPFNDAKGTEQIVRVFEHMFDNTIEPKFIVNCAAVSHKNNKGQLLLVWDFSFKSKLDKPFQWQGSSRVSFNDKGLVTEHIDYWDPVEALYFDIPLLGYLMRFLRKRLTALSFD